MPNITHLFVAKRTQIDEESLVSMLTGRNREAMEILYDNYASALFGVIHRIIQNDEIAEDVLQEAFLKIWNNFSMYDKTKGRLFTWMMNIARNLSIDKIRSKEFKRELKNQPLHDSVYLAESEEQAVYNPDTIGIKELVRALEPEYKQIIDLIYFGGFSQSEVAEKLNLPLGTVKTRSRAALKKLRLLFENVRTI